MPVAITDPTTSPLRTVSSTRRRNWLMELDISEYSFNGGTGRP
jgi:hypothetical protein